eukprot:scaffold627_cov125-Cylindrotheca_fusiformis.AAC.3
MGIAPVLLLLATTVLPTAHSFWLSAAKLSTGRPTPSSSIRTLSPSNVRRQWKCSMTWTACPTCNGEGEVRRAPSKKARLRQKRAKLETPLPARIEPCKKCNKTGLVESAGLPTTLNYPQVAIVGGGLGGLALGIACSHRGIPFHIYERDTSFSMRKQGYGLTLQQASRALASFGIQSLKEGVTSTRHVVHTVDGTPVGEWGLRKWGRDEKKAPPKRQNVHIARQALRLELLDALGGEQNVKWGHKLVGISDADGMQELEFEVTNGETVYHKADVIVGADGIRSTVRQHLLGPDTTPLRYLGCIVMLGICPLALLEERIRSNLLLDGHTVFQTADGSTRIYLMPYSSNEYMWQLSFPMDDERKAKDLSHRGPTALKKEALLKCGTWHSPIPDILTKTPLNLVSGYPVYDRDLITLPMMTSRDNNNRPVTLLGDAAHPMSPFKGQGRLTESSLDQPNAVLPVCSSSPPSSLFTGANQALLDALSLARCLYAEFGCTTPAEESETVVNSTSAVLRTHKALCNCHMEMIPRSTKKVNASAEAAQFLHTSVAIQEGNVTRGAAATSSSASRT